MIHDLRLATRLLLKSPAFTLVAVLTLGLGIGANTAIFSFINAFFLRAMPVRAPEELVALFTTDERAPGSLPLSQPNFADYETQNQVFSGMLSYTFTVVNTVVNNEPARLTGQMVSGNYFDLLGVHACTVGQRTREIGIRMAIGAQAGDVLGMVFKRGLLVAGAGIVVGVAAAFFITRLFQNLLYGIGASDPLTFLLIAALLALAAAAACFFPARRATKVDPLTALRAE